MECVFCGKDIANKGSLVSHRNRCHSNPDRVRYRRSPNAGQQKGCTPWNKGQKSTIDKWASPLDDVLIENSTYARSALRRRILKLDIIPYQCALCGIGPEWQGKPMPLILDHINGINNDHRLNNLRFVCSNCDTQLPTYKSRNRCK